MVVVPLALLPVGCSSGLKGRGQEIDLISETPSHATPRPTGSGPLWPLTPGRAWQTLTLRPDQPNTPSEIRVTGPYRSADGRAGEMVQSYRAGKLFRVEVFQIDPKGNMKMLALGESPDKLLVFTPSVPFLNAPVKEGEAMQWRGTARLKNQDYPATAYHRMSAVDTVKTPFDSLLAYRLDCIISLMNGTQRIDYPGVYWLVPGKGIAQRRLADQGKVALEVITRF